MKKIFALLLALLMLVSAIPFAAAEEAVECPANLAGTTHEENAKGFCGWCGKQMHVCSERDSHIFENGSCIHCGTAEPTDDPTEDPNEPDNNDPIGPGADDEDDDDDTGIAGHTHKYTGSYKYNATYHWHQCWCGKVQPSSKVKHTFNNRGECTKCAYEKNEGEYRVYLKESGKGDTKLSTRYADYGEYVYIYVDPDRDQKVKDIDVTARYSYKYDKCDKYDKYDRYDLSDYFEFSRYYDGVCAHGYNCDCFDYDYSYGKYTKSINVLKRSASCYYFRMPAADVTVEVTYTGTSYEDTTYGNYNDVTADDWFYSAVNYVTKYEIMPGTSYTKFSPNVNMDRATVALALYNISGAKASGRESFSDVDSNDWFYDAVVWCSNKGIIEGWNGKFDPYGEVTREDFAVMMHRYAEYKRYNTKAAEELDDFSDADKVSNYAVEALEWAVAEDLINGMGNGTLAPQGTTTRAQAAAVLMRFCKNVK